MAGICVPIYEVFKIGTKKLKYYNWNLTMTKKEALPLDELISLFEGQHFRLIAQILKRPPSSIDWSKYILSVVIESKSHFKRATSKKGIIVNGITFQRFVGTTGGLKDNTLLFVNANILDELNRRCDCGRDKTVKFIPAKLEAYKSLTCSASQEIISPKGILVVPDCITKFMDTVITLDNSAPDKESPTMRKETIEIQNNVSDGLNLCTIEYMEKVAKKLKLKYIPSGVCLRNAWLKGMLFPFPIIEFVEKYNDGNYMLKDIWGNMIDVREVEMILTESSLKLWHCYSSIDDYIQNYKKHGYEFAVTKIAPEKLEDQRELNYQYLQSYDFTEEDIKELCSPTVQHLKDSLCGNYEQTLRFLGISGNIEEYNWQKALATSSFMMNDPYIVDAVHRMIKKKIDNAKIGKLLVHGNYQIASGDVFALMQSVCGLEPTGLLKADECYSQYWTEQHVKEVCVFRSPMTSHNNIRKCTVASNAEMAFWYQYMKTVMVVNGWDTLCMALNGCDFDADTLFSTDNPVLLKRHIKLPAINCLQRSCEKVIVTDADILKSNINGMGNDVGKITNRVTSMMEVQARFPKNSVEYKELDYRIACGQQFQQDSLDKLKGIVSKPMPASWYNMKACGEDKFLQSICADKKPYFMTYIYASKKTQLQNYLKNSQSHCLSSFGCTIDELKKKENKTKEMADFLFWYDRQMPVGFSNCAMNQICNFVEEQFSHYITTIKNKNKFDYTKLKVKRRCTDEHREQLLKLCQEYTSAVASYKKAQVRTDKSMKTEHMNKNLLQKMYQTYVKEACPNDDERLNIILDICYGQSNNKMFCWDMIGELIIKRLKGLCEENEAIDYE